MGAAWSLVRAAPLHGSGCASNQGRFYPEFDRVILLVAFLDVLLARLEQRQNIALGKSATERARILADLEEFEPVLRRTSNLSSIHPFLLLRSSTRFYLLLDFLADQKWPCSLACKVR